MVSVLERFPLPLGAWDGLRYLLWHSLSFLYNYFVLDINLRCGYFIPFLLSEGVCIYNNISALFNSKYECCVFLDGINPL